MGVDGWEQDFKKILLVQKCFRSVTSRKRSYYTFCHSVHGGVSQHAMGRGVFQHAITAQGVYHVSLGRHPLDTSHGQTPPGRPLSYHIQMTVEAGGTPPIGPCILVWF